jgi:hypothetical protein
MTAGQKMKILFWPEIIVDLKFNERIMSYSKFWNWRRILELLLDFESSNFNWKKLDLKEVQIPPIELWSFISLSHKAS